MKKIILTETQLKRLLDEQMKDIGELTVDAGEITAYHGSPDKIENFTDEFVGDKDATDQEGPGIYFTTSRDDARGYGEFLYSVILRPNKLIDETSSENINPDELVEIIKTLPEWEGDAQNWAEDPETGLQMAVDSAIEYNDTEKDVFQQVWIEFFRYRPILFVKGMVTLGYDGQIIEKENGRRHVIVYNPDIIEVTNIETIEHE